MGKHSTVKDASRTQNRARKDFFEGNTVKPLIDRKKYARKPKPIKVAAPVVIPKPEPPKSQSDDLCECRVSQHSHLSTGEKERLVKQRARDNGIRLIEKGDHSSGICNDCFEINYDDSCDSLAVSGCQGIIKYRYRTTCRNYCRR